MIRQQISRQDVCILPALRQGCWDVTHLLETVICLLYVTAESGRGKPSHLGSVMEKFKRKCSEVTQPKSRSTTLLSVVTFSPGFMEEVLQEMASSSFLSIKGKFCSKYFESVMVRQTVIILKY